MITQIHILEPYSDLVGKLNGLAFSEGGLVATIGKISIFIPSALEDQLRPFIGQRIAMLRTDLPQKEYLFRVLTGEPEHKKTNGEGG
jgi:hypothetical protein